MFGIDLLDFILLLIDDWRLAMQANICQGFFCQSFVAVFSQTFLPPKFFL